MIASRIKELREVLGLSMPAFGRKLGCSRDVIANIEYGRSEPKEVLLNHVCDIYGVSREWLFNGVGEMLRDTAGDEKVREAAELFRSLSPDLRDLALSQMKSLQKLMIKKETTQTGSANNDLDTIRLMAAMLDAQDFGRWGDKTGESLPVGKRIRELMEDRGLTPEELAELSGLAEKEIEKVLNSKGSVKRDALIAVCLALSLDVEESQRLLTASGLPALYAKNRRDAACVFALMKKLSLKELNEMLKELEETPL